MSAELVASLNRLAGTSGLEAAGAANAFAGTANLELIGALNSKAGTSGKELNAVCSALSGTSGLDAAAALARADRPPTPAAPTISTNGVGSLRVAFTSVVASPAATSYTATLTPGGLTATGSTSPLTINGTTTLTSYTARVRAANLIGSSTDSAASAAVASL